jgi:mono/diheme cytochrome c family protein
VYEGNCKRCHGPEGRGAQGPSLIPFSWSYEKALDLIRHPVCDMPPFPESELSDAEVAQIVAYLKTIK